MTENESKPRLEFKQSSIHGTGGFATAPIRAGTLLIEISSVVRKQAANNTYDRFRPRAA